MTARFIWLLGGDPSGPNRAARRSNDGGASWFTQALPSNEPDVLHGTGPDNIWFTGGDMVYRWNGSSFQSMSGFSTTGYQAGYNIWVVDEDFVWICGFHSPRSWIWQSATGWVGKSVPGNAYVVNDIWAYDRNNAWACGIAQISLTNYGAIWRWNGSSWTQVYRSDSDGYTGSFSGVHGDAPDNVWFAGKVGVAGGSSSKNLLQWNGSTLVPRYGSPPSDPSWGCGYPCVTEQGVHLMRGSAGTGRMSFWNGSALVNKHYMPWPNGNSGMRFLDLGYDASGNYRGYKDEHGIYTEGRLGDDASHKWLGSSWTDLDIGESDWNFDLSTFSEHTLYLTGFNDLEITGFYPDPISEQGGQAGYCIGTFPALEDYDVHLGPNGDTSDPLCYGGQGYGYIPQSDVAGTRIDVVTPPQNFVGQGKVTVVRRSNGHDVTLETSPIVLERNWKSKLFTTRACHPPWKGVGPRRFSDEDDVPR